MTTRPDLDMHAHKPEHPHRVTVDPDADSTATDVRRQLSQRSADFEVVVNPSEELREIADLLAAESRLSKLTENQAKAGASLFFALYHHPAFPSLIMDGGALSSTGLLKAYAVAQLHFLETAD